MTDKFISLCTRLSAAYAKTLIHNPKDVIYDNIERAVNDCPDIIKSYEAFDDLLAVVKLIANYKLKHMDDYQVVIKIMQEEANKALLKQNDPYGSKAAFHKKAANDYATRTYNGD